VGGEIERKGSQRKGHKQKRKKRKRLRIPKKISIEKSRIPTSGVNPGRSGQGGRHENCADISGKAGKGGINFGKRESGVSRAGPNMEWIHAEEEPSRPHSHTRLEKRVRAKEGGTEKEASLPRKGTLGKEGGKFSAIWTESAKVESPTGIVGKRFAFSQGECTEKNARQPPGGKMGKKKGERRLLREEDWSTIAISRGRKIRQKGRVVEDLGGVAGELRVEKLQGKLGVY